MYFGILLALIPLFVGYLINCKNNKYLSTINKLLSLIVFFILFIMGIGLAQIEDISSNIQTIALYSVVLFFCTFGLNFIALIIIDALLPRYQSQGVKEYESRFKMIFESIQSVIYLLAGFVCGLLPLAIWKYTETIVQVVLVILLFLVGIQLRSNNISLKQILLNKIGMLTTLVVMVSAFLGGAIFAWLFKLPITEGMAMSSGFGWYSLSSILMTEAHGPIIGSVALLNDMLREVFAILLIPIMINRFRLTALGISGATSLDFTLPILQKGGGISIVPPAIVQGFLLTLFMPIFMTIFNHF